jgi:putative nucleotidyltransferase with HDIG domain
VRAWPRWRNWIQLILFALLFTAGGGLVLSSDWLLTRRVMIQEGQAASEDIASPRRIEFVSEIETQAAQQRALAEVKAVYDPLDRQVGREQVSLAQQVLDFVDSVRADSYASPAYQRTCLQSIKSVTFSSPVISDTLRLAEAEWKDVKAETRRVLAEVMRNEIRTGQEDVYRRAVRAMIAFELNESQTAIVEEIVSALIRTNRRYNDEATQQARQDALASVPPQYRVLEENEIIVRSGEIVHAEDIEALEQLGLLTRQIDWAKVSGTFLFVFLLAAFTTAYIGENEPQLVRRPHHLLLLALLLILFALLAKWASSEPISMPYLAPLAALGMVVTVLLNVRLGLVAHMSICLIVGYLSGNQPELFMYHLVSGLVGIFALRRPKRLNVFIWAGVYIMLADISVLVAFGLFGGGLEPMGVGQLILISLLHSAFSAILTLGGYSLLGMLFNIMTTLQLMDLARPTHPLMRQLLLKAPGTYHHSIMVGSMAEQAAEAIGADGLLARVGAFYHDIGKTLRPYFFSENQMDGQNPHDLLDPETSAHIIRSHTRDGLQLARKYHLPLAVRAFIAEHHGTSEIYYFYHRAIQEYGAERVNKADYVHFGPRPRTKETAIVMMADSCEAAVRSARLQDAEAMESLVRNVVAGKVSSGQLNDAPLTLREIDEIATSFVNTLQGVFHPRVRYPEGQETTRKLQAGAPAEADAPEKEAGERMLEAAGPEKESEAPQEAEPAAAVQVNGEDNTGDR